MGYSNLSSLLFIIKTLDEFNTNKLETSISNLKKFENGSLIKLLENIFSTELSVLNITTKVIIKIIIVKLKIILKLFLIKTPAIKVIKMEIDRKISGNKIFKLLIIFPSLYLNLPDSCLSNYRLRHLMYQSVEKDKNQKK